MKTLLKMKIGILVDELVSGGIQKTAIEETLNLIKLGHEAELIVMQRNKNPSFQDLTKDIKIRYLSDYLPGILKLKVKFPFLSYFSLNHLLTPLYASNFEFDYDYIISHGTTVSFTARAIWKKKKIPYIIFVHDPMIYIIENCYNDSPLRYCKFVITPIVRYYEKRLLNDSFFVITQSSIHCEFLQGLTNKKVHIVHLGANPASKISTKKNYILFATRWVKGKRVDLIRMIAKRFKDKKIVVAGAWTPEKLKTDFVKSLHEEDINNVEIYGRVTEQKLNYLYSRAVVLVHPIKEAFGMPVLEAAANSTTFIIPKGSGVNDLFENGIDGFFISEGNVRSIFGNIERLFSSRKICTVMGKSAWSKAKKYTWLNHTKKIIDSIKQVQK